MKAIERQKAEKMRKKLIDLRRVLRKIFFMIYALPESK